MTPYYRPQRVRREYALAVKLWHDPDDYAVAPVSQQWYPSAEMAWGEQRHIIDNPENSPDVVWLIAERTTIYLEPPDGRGLPEPCRCTTDAESAACTKLVMG